MIWVVSFYMITGVVCGLAGEEVNHHASSNADRDAGEYIFAAWVFAFLWPFLLAEVVRKNP